MKARGRDQTETVPDRGHLNKEGDRHDDSTFA